MFNALNPLLVASVGGAATFIARERYRSQQRDVAALELNSTAQTIGAAQAAATHAYDVFQKVAVGSVVLTVLAYAYSRR